MSNMADSSDEELSYTEEEETSSQPDTDTKSDDESDSSSNGYDPWEPLQDQALEQFQETHKELTQNYERAGNTADVAEAKASNDLLPKYRKALRQALLEKLKWMRAFRRDPVFREIKETRDSLMNMDNFD